MFGVESSNSLDNSSKLRLKRCTTDEETIDIGLLNEGLAVTSISRTTILDSNSSSNFRRDGTRNPRADISVSLLSHFGSSSLSSSNSPDRFISDNNAAPVGDGIFDSI